MVFSKNKGVIYLKFIKPYLFECSSFNSAQITSFNLGRSEEKK